MSVSLLAGYSRPAEIIFQTPPVLRMHPDGDASITLSACFDRGVELVFDDTKTDAATISVAWGSIEWERILLWSKSPREEPTR